MPNELCPSHGFQRCHLLLKTDAHGVVWPLYTQKVSVVLDSTTQKRLESSTMRLSKITAQWWFCMTLPHDLKKRLAEEAFNLKCSDVWHHQCWQLSQVPFSSAWSSRTCTCVTLTLENSSSKGSVTFLITLSPSGKVKTNHYLQVACACKCLVEKEPLCQEDKSWMR